MEIEEEREEHHNAGTPFIGDDDDDLDDARDDANLLQTSDDVVGNVAGIVVRREENHNDVGLREPSKFCSVKWIVVYTFFLLVIVIMLAGTGLLYFVPQAKAYNPPVLGGTMVILPITPPSVWLSQLDFVVKEDCVGQYKIYRLPQGTLPNVSHDTNYSKMPGEKNYQYHTYCLENSTFYFKLNENNVNISIGLFDDGAKSAESKCEDKVGVSRCIHLNQTHKSGNISVWATGYQGSFYSWKYWPNSASVDYFVDRYYYNSSLYSEYLQKNISSKTKFTVDLHKDFSPTDLSSDTYLFLEASHNCRTDQVTIQPCKRLDILFWPGIAVALIVILLFVVSMCHLVWFKVKDRQKHAQNLFEVNG